MKVHNKGVDIEKMISELEVSAERTILRILSYRVGREAAISRRELLFMVNKNGHVIDDRTLRLHINQLRKQEVPVCSTGGKAGGYWIAENWQELNDYLDNEVRARLKDLREQELALVSAGKKAWGEYNPDLQPVLFIYGDS